MNIRNILIIATAVLTCNAALAQRVIVSTSTPVATDTSVQHTGTTYEVALEEQLPADSLAPDLSAATDTGDTDTVVTINYNIFDPNDTTATHYLGFSLGMGINTIGYQPYDAKWLPDYGGQVKFFYQGMFTQNWGMSIGLECSINQAAATYSYSYSHKDLIHPDNGQLYDATVTFDRWRERQRLYMINIPIQFHYVHPLSDRWALGLGLGASLGFNIATTYTTTNGTYEISGYFPSTNVTYHNIEHGFTTTDYGYGSTYNNKVFNVGMLIDFGAYYRINSKADFYIGIYANHYFLNSIVAQKDELLVLNDDATADYSGTFASDRVEYVRPSALGIKVGFRFNLVDRLREAREAELARQEEAARRQREAELARHQAQLDSLRHQMALDSAAAVERALRDADLLAGESAAKGEVQRELMALRAEHDSLIRRKIELENRKRIAKHINSIAHFDSSQDFPYMSEEDKEVLKELADLMNQNPTVVVTIFGHADNSGDSDKNIIYGQRRAEALMKILVQHGADPKRIICVSRGDKDPVVSNETPEGRAQNRRAEIQINEL